MRVVIGLLIAMFGAIFQSSTPGEADEILTQLSKIRLDKKQISAVRDITLRRDALTIALNRGVLAFLEPVNGKVTGAVFIGSGEIVTIPPDPIEKQQIYKFTGTPILNEPFETAILRFTDNTYEELLREISQHAQEDVSAEDASQFNVWETAVAGRASALNLRLLPDFLETGNRSFFLAELKGERRGWFDVAFDRRAAEEVSIFQLQNVGNTAVPDIWASFNQRSEARNVEAVAHENQSPADVLSYDIDGTAGAANAVDLKVIMRMKTRIEGSRVLSFALSPTLHISSITTESGDALGYYQLPGASEFSVILPQGLKPSQDLELHLAYAGEMSDAGPSYPIQRQQSVPVVSSRVPLASGTVVPMMEYKGRKFAAAGYHDQWLIESLPRYLAAMGSDSDPAAPPLRKLLDDARGELKPVENAGPISLGQRLASTLTPNGYRAVYTKGVWVVHMLRVMLRSDGSSPDAKFLSMLEELASLYDGKAVSTWDFEHLAEKYAGKKLDWFFDQWIFATGVPSYSINYKIENAGGDFTIEGSLTQAGVPDGFMMSVPLYADGQFLGSVESSDSEGRFKFRRSTKPERLTIDPEWTILSFTMQ